MVQRSESTLAHSDSKKHDAEELGVKPEHFIIANDREATVKKWSATFDIILCTSFQGDLPLADLYFPLLAPEGTLVLVGLPENELPPFKGQMLTGKAIGLAGSM